MVTLRISPCTIVTLTFHFDFVLDHPVQEGSLHRDDEVTVKQKNYNLVMDPSTKTNWHCNLKLNLHHCTAHYRPVLSSEMGALNEK
jgi:hypothetical protein